MSRLVMSVVSLAMGTKAELKCDGCSDGDSDSNSDSAVRRIYFIFSFALLFCFDRIYKCQIGFLLNNNNSQTIPLQQNKIKNKGGK